MCNIKLAIAAAAVFGAGVAFTSDAVATCLTAPAVTTTITITTCGQPTWPAVPVPEANGHGTTLSPPPAQTSWLPSHPETGPVSLGSQAPGNPGYASPSPVEPNEPHSSPSKSSEEPSGASGKPLSGSSGKPTGESPSNSDSTTAATIAPSSSFSQTSGTPTKTSWTQPSTEPWTTNDAGSVVSMSLGTGSLVVIHMALCAGFTLLL